jgi:tetratricopeptide (TPR) repeat protein
MKRKVFITIAIAIILASASVSTAQPNNRIPTSQPSKSVPALSEEQVKSLIQAETEKKDALRGKAEAERKFDTTMVWVQVLLGGVSLLLAFIAIVPVSLGVLVWIFRKSIFGQLNAEANEEVAKQVEEHIKPIIDTEIQAQISALIEKKLSQRIQEFEAAVPTSTQEIPSPERLSQIEELRRRIEDLQDLMPTMMMQSAEYYVKQGNAFYFEKRYEEAISSYDKALAFKPNDSEIWSNRGVMLGELKRYEEAIVSHDKAIELNPEYPDSWYNRACCYALQEKVKETVFDLKKAIELDSTCREEAKTESDFDKVRHDEGFQKLLNGEL